MKSRMFFCAAFFFVTTVATHADTIQIEGINYDVDKEAREASVVKGTDRDTLVIADSI